MFWTTVFSFICSCCLIQLSRGIDVHAVSPCISHVINLSRFCLYDEDKFASGRISWLIGLGGLRIFGGECICFGINRTAVGWEGELSVGR